MMYVMVLDSGCCRGEDGYVRVRDVVIIVRPTGRSVELTGNVEFSYMRRPRVDGRSVRPGSV